MKRRLPNSQAKSESIYVLRGKWRDQLFADRKLNGYAFKVGYALSMMMTHDDSAAHYRETGRILVWPSQSKLHELTGISIDTIRQSIIKLIDQEHLKLSKRGNQFTGSNTYRIMLKKREATECR